MICAGKVLSQPPITTTASIGWARIISSVSIAIRLRRYIEVGNAKLSAIEIVGNTIGSAPAPAASARHDEDGLRPLARGLPALGHGDARLEVQHGQYPRRPAAAADGAPRRDLAEARGGGAPLRVIAGRSAGTDLAADAARRQARASPVPGL